MTRGNVPPGQGDPVVSRRLIGPARAHADGPCTEACYETTREASEIYPPDSGTPEHPEYRMFKENNGAATAFYGISVDEGWRSWIMCTGMYQDKAEQLLSVLRAATALGWRWRE